MSIGKKSVGGLFAALIAIALISSTDQASAQSYEQYCREKAENLSGYKKNPNVVKGAVTGAIGGAVLGSVLGGTNKSRNSAALVGAVVGGVSAANKSNAKAAHIYKLEYQDCMKHR